MSTKKLSNEARIPALNKVAVGSSYILSMKKERFFALKRPFKHPYIAYEIGTNYTARMWADRLGHGMKEKEFIKLVESDDRFKQYFRETTSE